MQKLYNSNYIKYLIILGILYALLKVVPFQKLQQKDVILILLFVILLIYFIDCKFSNNNVNEKFDNNIDDNMAEYNNLLQEISNNLDSIPVHDDVVEQPSKQSVQKESSEQPSKQSVQKESSEQPSKQSVQEQRSEQLSKQLVQEQGSKQLVQEQLSKQSVQEQGSKQSVQEQGSKQSVQEQGSEQLSKQSVQELSKQLTQEQNKHPKQILNQILQKTVIKNAMQENQEATKNKYYNLLTEDLLSRNIITDDDVNNINIKLETKLLTIDEVIIGLEKLKKSNKINQRIVRNKTLNNDEDDILTRQNKQHSNEENEDNISTKQNKQNKQNKQHSNDTSNNNKLEDDEPIETKPKKQTRQNDNNYNELPASKMRALGDDTTNLWADNYTILNTDKWKVPMTQPPVCINTSPCKVCPSDGDGTNFVSLSNWDDSRKVSNISINKKWSNNQLNSSRT